MPCTLLLLAPVSSAPEIEVHTLDGQTLSGAVVELSADRVVVGTPEDCTAFDAEKLLGFSPKEKSSQAAAAPTVWVDLVDGSALLAKSYAVDAGQTKIGLVDGSTVEAPTRDVAAVRLQAATEAIDKEWNRILNMKLDGDVLVVRKDETIDYHKGVLRNVDDKAVSFEMDGETIPVKRAKVFGMAYYHAADRELPGAACALVDAGGSRWAVRTLALGEKLQWTTPCGLKVERPLDRVANVDFSGGKILYLSDLKADSVQWTPYFGTAQQLPAVAEFYAPRMDQNLSAKPLQLANTQYKKGIAIHSRTEMVYRLPGRFSRFKAIAGIDDEVAPNGHVRLLIRGDDKVLLDTTVAGTDKPKPIDLDLSGVRRLTIFVDFGEKLDVGDHLDLCLARIIK